MANFWENDEVVELVVEPEVAVEAPKAETTGTNFWDKDTVVGLIDLATTPQEPAPVSEDPDRQFFQSGVPMEDRVFEPKLPEVAQPDFVDDSLNQILVSEGGFQDDKEDTGNYRPDGTLVGTNRGITPTALAEFKGVDPNSITVEDIKNVTEEEARTIYRQNYFNKPKINELPQDLQASVFDMYINSGSNAIKILQKAAGLPKKKQDGSVGPETLAAITSKEEYADARIAFYKDLVKRKPKTKKYLNGWITRANKYR
jgi:hypothetical protein